MLTAGAAQATVVNFDDFAAGSTQAVGAFDAFGVRFNQNIFIGNGTRSDLPSSPPNTGINGESFGGSITGFSAEHDDFEVQQVDHRRQRPG